jgi:predicted permease
MKTILRNVKQAIHQLAKSPAFSLIAIFTLAIGIGVTTVMFSVVQNVLLKPLRYPDPQQLVVFRESISAAHANYPDLPINANHFLFWQANNRSFSSLAALSIGAMPLGGDRAEEMNIAQATPNLISLLGFAPRLGRTFTAEEEKPGHQVVILTHGLWKRRYASAPDVIGKTIPLDGKPYSIIGVLPTDFALPSSRAIGGFSGTDQPIEAFIPFGWTAEQLQEIEGDHNYFAIGRLKPGVTVIQAAADIRAMQRQISQQTPDKVDLSATVIPFQEYLVGASRNSLLLMLGAVFGVLLIACVNITNLLLTRMAGRANESALRAALGASRRQLMVNALMEPLLLTAIGGVVGVALAVVALPLLLRWVPTGLPRLDEVQIDLPVLAFAIGLSILAASGCGIVPAWRFSRGSAQGTLRSETRTASESKATRRLRQVLVVGEVTASTMLVLLAALFISSLTKLLHVDRGFQTERVLSADFDLPDKQYAQASARNSFYEQILLRLRQLPGVQSAGMVSVLPLDGDNWNDLISKTGNTQPLWEKPDGHFRWITPGYFETLQVPLLAGRFLSEADRSKRVAVISRHTAETVWPSQSAIGQRFTRGDPGEPPIEVIGVVGDLRTLDLSQTAPRMVYMPYWYRSREHGSIAIRTAGDPSAMASAIRKAVSGLDSEVAIPEIRTMQTVVDSSVVARRFQMRLLLAFAASSLLLAGLGIYGVVAYSTVQRTQEIGIRMALGANRSNIYRLILLEGIAPVLIGTLLGAGLASLTGRFLASFLFEVHPGNPLIAGFACALLIVVGLSASLLAAWRATAIEPVRALRSE